jgi:hypothetical protein
VLHGRGAQDELIGLFTGDNPPTFVVQYQTIGSCNPNGKITALLRDRYTPGPIVGGLRIFVLHKT